MVVEAIEGAWLKGIEGIISGGKNGHPLRSVVELIVELGVDFGFVEEADERRELAALFENAGYVEWPRRGRSGSRRGLGQSGNREEKEGEEEEEESGGGHGGGAAAVATVELVEEE